MKVTEFKNKNHLYNNCEPGSQSLSASDITGTNRSISCLKLAFHLPNNPWLEVDVDLVPAIKYDILPETYTIPSSIEKDGCMAVIKWFSDDPDNTNIFRLSCCAYDLAIFNVMPTVLKYAYKLAKIVIHDTFCPMIKKREYLHSLRASELISSYILKVCVLQLYVHITEGKKIQITPDPDRVKAIQKQTKIVITDVMY